MRTYTWRSAAALTLLLAGGVVVPVAAMPDGGSPAQESDLAGELNGYQRFVVYPHLQKGFESLQRGDRARALAEFERAHELVPESPTVALYLADAYRQFGEPGRAEAVLRRQLERAPTDARLRTAVESLRIAARPTRAPAAGPTCREAHGCLPATTPPTAHRDAVPATIAASPATARAGARRAGTPPAAAVRTAPTPRVARPPVVAVDADPRMAFTHALQTQRFDDARREAERMLAGRHDLALLDELTFQMVGSGAASQARHLLVQAYPYTTGAFEQRDRLVQRLGLLAAGVAEDDDARWRLRAPLDTPALRSRQAVIWKDLGDCSAVRGVLSDMSPDYGHDDWMRLGDCAVAENPPLAIAAYTRAHQLQPGGTGSRALGYQAHASGDYRTALAAWRTVGEQLAGDDLIAAALTALSAGEADEAATYAGRYLKAGAPLDRRYWMLRADIDEVRGERVAAAVALDRALALMPRADDYVRLARLQARPEQQIGSLERASTLEPRHAMARKELGYAYVRAGRSRDALAALTEAAALDPRDAALQIALGYLHWDRGDMPAARTAFQNAWDIEPGNAAAAEQLVYVHQRLHNNAEARRFAEHVLDADPSRRTTESETARANRTFGMRRLHEDLGRRLTVSLDTWGGTHIGTGTSGSLAGSRYSSYGQLEADIRLGTQTVRNGTTVSAFARLMGDGGAERTLVPAQNRTLGVGLRWKPFRRHVLYFSGEGQTPVDGNTRQRDVLLRASASLLNGGHFSDDWHAAGTGWFAQNLFVDAAHYVRSELSAFTADYRNSYHQKIAGSQTIEPYAHVQLNGLRGDRVMRDLRVGVGSRWNLWYGGSRYDAAPHKLVFGLEFQQAIDTYLPDRRGVFASIGTRW